MVKTHDSVLTNIKYMRKYAGKLLPYSRVQLTEVGFESMLWGLSVFPVSQKSRKVLCNLSTYPNRRSWTNKTFFLVAPLLEMWHEKNRKQYRLCSWIWEGFWNMCLSLFFLLQYQQNFWNAICLSLFLFLYLPFTPQGIK